MSVFVDCMVCRSRVIVHDDLTDAQFISIVSMSGWTVTPTRCPDHAGEEGQALVDQGYASKQACAAEHDPTPWTESAGLMVAGNAVHFGGPTTGQVSLHPREAFCQEKEHYFLYDRFTLVEQGPQTETESETAP